MKTNKYKLSLSELNVQDRRRKITKEDIVEMKKLYRQNLSYGKIAGILGLTYANVYLNLNPLKYKKYKKWQSNYFKKWIENNRDKYYKYQSKYRTRKKQLIDNMDVSNLVQPKNTIKNRILNFLTEDRLYKFSEIHKFLNKDYSFFSRALHDLAKNNLIEIVGVRGNQSIRRIKNDK